MRNKDLIYTLAPIQNEMLVYPCGSAERMGGAEVWDAADLISQPSENEVFVTTNVVVGFNQFQGHCPQVSLNYTCIIHSA